MIRRKQLPTPAPTTMSGWREILPVHPAAELFPLLSPEELKVLADDIANNGLKVPVETWIDPETKKLMLVDGRNRLDALESLGYQIKIIHNSLNADPPRGCKNPVHWGISAGIKLDAPDPYALVVSLNINRRHLTREQRAELVEKLLKADPTKSDRAIAKMTKSSPTTVGAKRANVQTGHKNGDRIEASGRRARGRKPIDGSKMAERKPIEGAEGTQPSAKEITRAIYAKADKKIMENTLRLPFMDPSAEQVSDIAAMFIKVHGRDGAQRFVDALTALLARLMLH